MTPTTYYDLLHIDDEATRAEVRKAYLRLAATCHPDKSLDDPDATEKFQLINEAYTTLYDDDARRRYDKKLNEPDEVVVQRRPCHVPVYHPPPTPTPMPIPAAMNSIPPFHLSAHIPAPAQHFVPQIYCMYPTHIPSRHALHRNHFFVSTHPVRPAPHAPHFRPSPPMPRPGPPMMRLMTPPSPSIPPEYVRFQMLCAAEARRRSF